MTKHFLAYHLKAVSRYFKENRSAKILVAFFMLLSIFILSYGIFLLTERGLLSTQDGEDFVAKAIPLYIYQVFLLIIGFLIFVSTIIFSLFNFLKTKSDSWIITSPKFNNLAWLKYFKAIIESSWPIIVIGFPLIFAIKEVFNFPIIYFLIGLFSLIIFSFLCASLAVILVFFLSFFFGKKFNLLVFLSGLISMFFGFFIWARVVSIDLVSIFQLQETISPSLEVMKANFAIFPSHYPAMIIHYLQIDSLSSAILMLFYLFILFLLSVSVFVFLKIKFLYFWQIFQEGQFEARRGNSEKPKLFYKGIPKSPEDVIQKKELLTTFRSPQNFFWFSFLIILMLIQIGVVNLLENYIGIGDSQDIINVGITPSLQLAVILFFASSFCLRFIFPSFSQEGSTSWMIGSAPINLKKVFLTKYKFYSFLLIIAGFISLFLYIIPLSVAFSVSFVLFLAITIGILTLVMISLSMGVIFINFETTDPQKLSTSPAGIIFILISLLYGGAGAVFIYYLFLTQNCLYFFFFFLLSLILFLSFKFFAIKSLKELEFF